MASLRDIDAIGKGIDFFRNESRHAPTSLCVNLYDEVGFTTPTTARNQSDLSTDDALFQSIALLSVSNALAEASIEAIKRKEIVCFMKFSGLVVLVVFSIGFARKRDCSVSVPERWLRAVQMTLGSSDILAAVSSKAASKIDLWIRGR